jgi:hypothetical protein
LVVESLTTRHEVNATYADLSATLAESRDAVLARLDRGLRRRVFVLSALMVASAPRTAKIEGSWMTTTICTRYSSVKMGETGSQ